MDDKFVRRELKLAIILVSAGFLLSIIILLIIINTHDAGNEETSVAAKHHVSESAEKIGENITAMAKEMAPLGETYKRMKEYNEEHGSLLEKRKKSTQESNKE